MWAVQNKIGNELLFALPTLPTLCGMWFAPAPRLCPRDRLPTLPTGQRPFCCTAQIKTGRRRAGTPHPLGPSGRVNDTARTANNFCYNSLQNTFCYSKIFIFLFLSRPDTLVGFLVCVSIGREHRGHDRRRAGAIGVAPRPPATTCFTICITI